MMDAKFMDCIQNFNFCFLFLELGGDFEMCYITSCVGKDLEK